MVSKKIHLCVVIKNDHNSGIYIIYQVSADLTVKLADLGECRLINEDTGYVDKKDVPVNLNWASPELLDPSIIEIGQSSDVWALAMVLSEILSCQLPFDGEEYRHITVHTILGVIEEGKRPSIPEACRKYPWLYAMVGGINNQ